MTAPGMEWWDSGLKCSGLSTDICIASAGWNDCEGRGWHRGGQLLCHGRQGGGRGLLRRVERGWVLRLSRAVIVSLKILFRTKFFIKFPGRNLGGYLAFIKGSNHLTEIASQAYPLCSGFRDDLWVCCVVFIFTVPAFLWASVRIQKYYRLGETYDYSYTMNIFILFYTLSQQVKSQGIN